MLAWRREWRVDEVRERIVSENLGLADFPFHDVVNRHIPTDWLAIDAEAPVAEYALPPAGSTAHYRVVIGIVLGRMLGSAVSGIPPVAGTLLWRQEAAGTEARGVAVAYARLIG